MAAVTAVAQTITASDEAITGGRIKKIKAFGDCPLGGTVSPSADVYPSLAI